MKTQNNVSAQELQSATVSLTENLRSYPESYNTKEDFVSFAWDIYTQFPDEDHNLTEEEISIIAGNVWEEVKN